MKSYTLLENVLILYVKKAPFIIRISFFSLAFIAMMLPIATIAFALLEGEGLSIAIIFAFSLFFIMAYFLLKLALWNSFGKEYIIFDNNEIHYYADYSFFKDDKTTLEVTGFVNYLSVQVGYLEDKMSVLVIETSNNSIRSTAKIPHEVLEALILELQTTFSYKNSEAADEDMNRYID